MALKILQIFESQARTKM